MAYHHLVADRFNWARKRSTWSSSAWLFNWCNSQSHVNSFRFSISIPKVKVWRTDTQCGFISLRLHLHGLDGWIYKWLWTLKRWFVWNFPLIMANFHRNTRDRSNILVLILCRSNLLHSLLAFVRHFLASSLLPFTVTLATIHCS